MRSKVILFSSLVQQNGFPPLIAFRQVIKGTGWWDMCWSWWLSDRIWIQAGCGCWPVSVGTSRFETFVLEARFSFSATSHMVRLLLHSFRRLNTDKHIECLLVCTTFSHTSSFLVCFFPADDALLFPKRKISVNHATSKSDSSSFSSWQTGKKNAHIAQLSCTFVCLKPTALFWDNIRFSSKNPGWSIFFVSPFVSCGWNSPHFHTSTHHFFAVLVLTVFTVCVCLANSTSGSPDNNKNNHTILKSLTGSRN